MTRAWTIVQLSPEAEDVKAEAVLGSLRRFFGVEVLLLEGYALVESAEPRRDSHRFVARAMRGPRGELYTMTDVEVRRLFRPRPLRSGASARVASGPFRGLCGQLEEVGSDEVRMRVPLRSTEAVVTVSRAHVEHAAE